MRAEGYISILSILFVNSAGCAAPSAEPVGATDTAFVGAMPELRGGERLTVRYTPAASSYGGVVPYLAIKFVGAPATAPVATGLSPQSADAPSGELPQRIVVEGDFPSLPEVLVLDQDFTPGASPARTTIDGALDITEVEVPRDSSSRFVLVRDPLWSLPMDFVVSAP